MSKPERRVASHEITKSIRDDYISYVDGILTAMKKAERTGNSREITKLKKQLSGNSTPSNTMPSKDPKGNQIVNQDQLLASWNTFLSEKFSSPAADKERQPKQTVSPKDSLSNEELEEASHLSNATKLPAGIKYQLRHTNTHNQQRMRFSG